MRRPAGFAAVFVISLLTIACASAPVARELVPGEQTTIHVGERVTLAVPDGSSLIGFAGTSLVQTKEFERARRYVHLYRAVAPGNMTFVQTPNGIPDGHCISCVTEHYYVTVVP